MKIVITTIFLILNLTANNCAANQVCDDVGECSGCEKTAYNNPKHRNEQHCFIHIPFETAKQFTNWTTQGQHWTFTKKELIVEHCKKQYKSFLPQLKTAELVDFVRDMVWALHEKEKRQTNETQYSIPLGMNMVNITGPDDTTLHILRDTESNVEIMDATKKIYGSKDGDWGQPLSLNLPVTIETPSAVWTTSE